MILRRFTQHIKGQNWFAVGLDVIVVIVGIFLGLQVTDWNENRKAETVANEFINQLILDTNEAIKNTESSIEMYEQKQRRSFLIIEILKGTKLDESNREEFELGLQSLPYLNQTQLHIGALGQLLDGDLPEMIDSGIRRKAIELQDELAYFQKTLAHIEFRLDAQMSFIDTQVAATVKFDKQVLPYLYDINKMRESTKYLIAVQSISVTTQNILSNLNMSKAALEKFQKDIEN